MLVSSCLLCMSTRIITTSTLNLRLFLLMGVKMITVNYKYGTPVGHLVGIYVFNDMNYLPFLKHSDISDQG